MTGFRGVRQRQEEERITPNKQSWKSEVWCCNNEIYDERRESGQAWAKKDPIGHPSRAAQKSVMIHNQGVGELDADLRCIGEATLLRERSR